MLVFSNGGAKRKSRKVTRGRVSKAMDVRSRKQVKGFEDLLTKGPLTLVLVYADWCGACHRFRENTWKDIQNLPNKSINVTSVREDVFPETSLKNTQINHYPSLLLVGNNKKPAEFTSPKGETTNVLPNNSKELLTKIVTSPLPETASEIVNNATNANLANSFEAISTAKKNTPKNNASPPMEDLFESVKPPSMAEDLDSGFEPMTASELVANSKKTPIAGGGLLKALSQIISKGTKALRIRTTTRKRKGKARKTRKVQKRNKAGRFSRRR
jgi:thiol-disulfide isomerase/thioredoxin